MRPELHEPELDVIAERMTYFGEPVDFEDPALCRQVIGCLCREVEAARREAARVLDLLPLCSSSRA